MSDKTTEPYIVHRGTILGAIITSGENAGLPIVLAALICNGTLSRKDVQERGWKYGWVEL